MSKLPLESKQGLCIAAILLMGLSCSQTSPTHRPESIPSSPSGHSQIQFTSETEQTLPVRETRPKTVINDDNAHLSAIEPRQVCIVNANEAEAQEMEQALQPQGYHKKKRRVLEGLEFVMSIYQIPQGELVSEGIADLRRQFPSYVIDANHLYGLQEQTKDTDPRLYGQHLIGWDNQTSQCGANIRVGMVDTQVNLSQPALRQQHIMTQSFLSKEIPQAPGDHGTAVATLLVGKSSSMHSGLVPDARLFVAETFRQSESGRVETNTWTIIRALDWLVKEKVQVINLSLGGSRNALLSLAINRTLHHNIPIVAAAGNTDSYGQPMYPAAEEGVIAVTALDAKLDPYVHAARGSFITFAAPGVDIWVPTERQQGIFKSGTSFATPFVTAAVAALRSSHPQWNPNHVAQQLAQQSLDLGHRGKDEIFGWGLIQLPKTCSKEQPATKITHHAQPVSVNPKHQKQ